MAGEGYEALGKARRGLIRRQQATNILSGILDTAGTVTAFAQTQAKRAKSAWEGYEAGHKALGGEGPIIKPKFGEKGWFKSTFKGPSGEITIGDKVYDMKKVSKAGTFLGGETAAALFAGDESGKLQKDYLKRTVPGRWSPESFTKPAEGPKMIAPDFDIKSATRSETSKSWKDNLLSQYEGKNIDAGPQIPVAIEGPSSGIAGTGLSAAEWVQKQKTEGVWDWEASGRPTESIDPSPLRRDSGAFSSQLANSPQLANAGPQIPKQYGPTYAMSSEERELYERSGNTGYRFDEEVEGSPKRNVWESFQLNNKNRRQY